MIYALLSAFLQAISLIINKVGLKRRTLHTADYATMLFGLLSVWGWISVIVFHPQWNIDSYLSHLSWFIGIVLTAAGWNYIYLRSVKHEKASVVETLMNLSIPASVFVSWLSGSEQFSWLNFVLLMIGICVLLSSFRKHHHFELDKYLTKLVMAIILLAIENTLVKISLSNNYFEPISLYALRTSFIAVLFWIVFRPGKIELSWQEKAILPIASLVGATLITIKWFSFAASGVVTTSLIWFLVPVIVFMSSVVFLKEKPEKKHILAVVILLAICSIVFVLD